MSKNDKSETLKIVLDDREVEVPAGINLVEAAALHGKEVPHYCYHPKLSVAGNCRMCLVEMGMPLRDRTTGEPVLDEDGSQKIGWIPKPVIGCGTNVAPGMHVKTDSDMANECREGIMEFLLVNHPLDCPICDQAGECRLQEFAMDYGRGYSRYVERKNVKPKRTRLGPRVTLDDERCILCSRCIRFCQEVANDDVLGFIDRGSYSTLACYPGKELANNYSLNTVDLCPVGALTSSDFRFKMRVWFLKETQGICTESSAGCNTIVSSREGRIYRITPRRNDHVNDTWMPDSGRELHKEIVAENRVLSFRINNEEASRESALAEVFNLLQGGKVGVVGSCRSTVEEQFLLRSLASHLNARVYVSGHFGEDDGLLLSADRTPNLRGALATGLISKYPADNLKLLGRHLAKGDYKALLVVNEDIISLGVSQEQLEGCKVVFLGTKENSTSKLAEVILPGLSVFEKCGTFINRGFRLQKFESAVPAPSGLSSESFLLNRILSDLSGEPDLSPEPDALWSLISKLRASCLSGITLGDVGEEGIQLDPGKLADLPYVEAKALHFTPTPDRQPKRKAAAR